MVIFLIAFQKNEQSFKCNAHNSTVASHCLYSPDDFSLVACFHSL